MPKLRWKIFPVSCAGALLACLLPSFSFAESEEKIVVSDNAEVTSIPFYRKEECLRTLRPIVSPEAVITAGLSAISNGAGAGANAFSCLDEILPSWEKLLPPAKANPASKGKSDDDDGESTDSTYVALMKAYEAVDREVDCINSSTPGSPAHAEFIASMKEFCAGKFTDPSLKAAKEAELKKASEALMDYTMAKNFDRDLSSLAPLFFPDPPRKPELEELRKKAACVYYGEGTTLPEHCGGKLLTTEERAAVGTEISKLREEESTLKAKADNSRYSMRRLLMDKDTVAKLFDVPKLKEKLRRVKCLGGPADSATPAGNNGIPIAVKRFCEKNSYPTTGDRAPLFKEVRELLPDPAAALAHWEADAKKREEEKQAKLRLLKVDKTISYGLRRLLNLYRWHAGRYSGTADPLDRFCAYNEKIQLQDLEFSRTMPLRALGMDYEWAWAGKHGLSEGEITAVKEYTGSFYHTINGKIWRAKPGKDFEPLDEKHQLFRRTLNQALDRAAPYRGKPVRRWSGLPDEVLKAHEVGKVVTYDAFTSTSSNQEWNWGGGNRNAHGFLIYSANGVDVNDISDNKGEDEILFKAGTRFKVVSRKQRDPGKELYDFVMVEVDENGQPLASLPTAPPADKP